jgi:CheY-like chemotaxis protein
VAGLVPAAEGKNILIDADLGSDPCPVLGDPSRLQQVIWNVLSNAVKFTPHGGTITIRLRRTEDATIDIRDTGAGIEPELLPHIFERLRQGDPAANRRKGGLGLGLAIAKHLVALHGGTIEAQSDGEGKGATFTIHLPLATAKGEPFMERDLERSVALPRLDGIRVLIVDDEADNRDVIAAIAQRCGAEVMCTATAASGMDVLRRWRPDMIVCDIALPDVDGCAFLERVRALAPEEGGQTPALALTVLSARGEQERILAAGFQSYRQKPIEPADLAHDIARLAASRMA